MITVHLFVRSLLWAGAQPTLDPSIENLMLAQCTSPGRGGELVGVCVTCWVKEGLSRSEQLVGYFNMCPI